MTTNVPKGAGRKAAAEKRNRHAQRTPLPPKAGRVEDAREVIAEILRPKGRKVSSKAPGKAPGSTEKPATAKVGGRTSEPAGSVKPVVQTRTSGSRSEAKSSAFAQAAKKSGWDPIVEYGDGDLITIVASRGSEEIRISWDGGVFQADATYRSPAGRILKVRNAAAGKATMSAAVEAASGRDVEVAGRKAPRFAKKEAPARPVALELGTVGDAEILEMVDGKKISFINRVSGEVETDFVTSKSAIRKPANRPKITEGPSGRVLSFVGSAGWRSVLVSQVTRIGR